MCIKSNQAVEGYLKKASTAFLRSFNTVKTVVHFQVAFGLLFEAA